MREKGGGHTDKKWRTVVNAERGNEMYWARIEVKETEKKREGGRGEQSGAAAPHTKEIILILDVTSLFTSAERKRCGSRNSLTFNLIHRFLRRIFRATARETFKLCI